MAANMQQFLKEATAALKPLGIKHKDSRASYKEAVESLALKRMPRASESDRRKFVVFALKLYDAAKRMDAAEKYL